MTENRSGITGAVTELGNSAIKGLQGPMLALVILNALFFGVGFFFLHNQQADRNAMINKIFDVCLANATLSQQLHDEVVKR